MAIGVYKMKVSIPEIGIKVASCNTNKKTLQRNSKE